ncbi:uncharacterized protein LOC132393812 isoform X2 [Hypanus sabinus]|uniref:uncharacterized protein LOC132393812 isoform X2 n=1 Tax=Hypanus sabinus TaxID=79690 RepID=UPI0028C4128D|nr:uncharacterized protein LOC132393812 isoform X2 [Hypanus sabinus]
MAKFNLMEKIGGEILLLVSVFLLVLLKFCPARMCSKHTEDDYYQVKYERSLEKTKRTKKKEELRKKVEKAASEEAKDFICQLELGNMNPAG